MGFHKIIDLTDCDKEPIHLLGKIQSHGLLLAFRKNNRSLAYASHNASDLFGDSIFKNAKLLADFFDTKIISFFDFLKEETFYNTLYNKEVMIQELPHLLFFSNSGDYIIIEIEKQSQDFSKFEEFNEYKAITQSIKNASDKEDLINTTVHFLKEFTGFNRIMVYQFDENGDGEVIAEEKSLGLESFLGLKYPASDIPQQARKLYETNLSRSICDVNDEGIGILNLENNNKELDLSYSVYRSVSPVHIQYLKNMKVTATHAVSILIENKLWGMLICHNYNGTNYLNFNTRFLLEMVGASFSNKMELLEVKHLQRYEEAQNRILDLAYFHEQDEGFDQLLVDHWDGISKQLDASGFTIFQENEVVFNYGLVPKSSQIKKLHQRILTNKNEPNNILNTDAIKDAIKDWDSEKIAGCICFIISSEAGRYIHFWRSAKEQVINWAGNPEKAISVEEKSDRVVLSPRASFDLWMQKEKGRSMPWLPHHKRFANNLYEVLIRKELKFYKNIFDKNNQLKVSGKKLKSLLEIKSNELSHLNYQLQNELKSNKKYQKELEIALKTGEEINAIKTKVLSNISHEIRTPITSIIGMTSILLKRNILEEKEQSFVKLILESAERLLNTTNRILLTSKIEKDKTNISIKNVDVVPITKKIIASMQIDALRKDINLLLLSQNKEILAFTDEHYYNQILTNLVSNAIKYSKPKGSIEINLKLIQKNNKNYVFLSVEDNGVGIHEENLDKIFEPYFTEGESTLQADQSTGVGLYIVKSNITQLGGSIKVISEKGKGSIFNVLIPTKND